MLIMEDLGVEISLYLHRMKKILGVTGLLLARYWLRQACEEKQHIWTQEEISQVLNKEEPFNSRHHSDHRSMQSSVHPSPSSQLQQTLSYMSQIDQKTLVPQNVNTENVNFGMREVNKQNMPTYSSIHPDCEIDQVKTQSFPYKPQSSSSSVRP